MELKRSTWMAWEEALLLIGRYMGGEGRLLGGVASELRGERVSGQQKGILGRAETGKDVKMVAMFGKNE